MGLPAYPPDWAQTMRDVQKGLKQAMTAAQTRVRYAAIRAAKLIVGPEQGARIEIDPIGGPGGAPAITFRPQTGSKVAVLLATSQQFADEVTVVLRGGVNNANSVYTEVTMGGGIVRAAVRDANSGDIVRLLDIAEDYSWVGSAGAGKPYVYCTDTEATVNGPEGGYITVAEDGGIGIYAASDSGAFIELSPSGTVNKGGDGW